MFDTGCCGANLKQDVISKWGVFSLSIPLFYIMLCFYIILWPFSLITSPLTNFSHKMKIIMMANWKLAQKVQFMPKLKCQISSYFYSFTPRLSGSIFKIFNISAFTFIWILLVGFFKISVEFI